MEDPETNLTEVKPTSTEVMSPEESVAAEGEIFRQIVTSAEISRESLREAWENYRKFTSKRLEVEEDETLINPERTSHQVAERDAK